jgi:hypothetical protein
VWLGNVVSIKSAHAGCDDHDRMPESAYSNEFREPSEAEREAIPALDFKPWGFRPLDQIKPVEFVYSDFYARGYTTLTAAPPKVGKSMLGLAEALDMATGAGILTGHERIPLRVLYYNAEDDMSVIEARTAALLCRYRIDQSAIAETLFPISGVDAEGFYMVTGQEGVINEPLFVGLEKFIAANKIDVLIFDPLQDLSRSPETNEVFRILGQRLRRLASMSQVALGLVHHTRKLAPGVTASIDDARGGGALRGTCRFNRLLLPMTEDEGAKAGVENHRHFIRIADMEGNLAPPSADVNRWFQKVSVPIPNGQRVGAIEPWSWPDAFMGLRREDAAAARSAIGACDPPARENIQSPAWAGIVIAEALGLPCDDSVTARNRLKSLLKEWVKSGVLCIEEWRDPQSRRDVKVVRPGPNNPMTEVDAS